MSSPIVRLATAGLLVLWTLAVGCRRDEPEEVPPEVAAQDYTEALAAFNRGGALLEQYDYAKAVAEYERAVALAPAWTAARFNLGLALLNMQGEAGKGESLERAREIFEQIVAAEPEHRSAHFCLGMYYQHLGKNEIALEHFEKVHRADPDEPYAAYKCAETLGGLGRNDEAIETLEAVLAQDPGFVSGYYRLAMLYQRTRQREKAQPLFERFRKLSDEELDGKMFTVGQVYGTAGKYYLALDARSVPVPPKPIAARLLWDPEPRTIDAPLTAWPGAPGDVTVPGIAMGDLNGDGRLDLLLTGQSDRGGAQVWLNDGEGHFAPAQKLGNGAVSPCLGDVDNDGDLDAWIGSAGPDALWLNDGKANFTRVEVAPSAETGRSATARLLDLDSDGDLDLLSFRNAGGRVYNNNRDGKYPDIAEKVGLALPDRPIAAVLCDDFDGDRDLDLVLFPTNAAPLAWVNDRAGLHHTLDAKSTGLLTPGVSATTCDVNQDGLRDILVIGEGLHLYLNRGNWKFEVDPQFEALGNRLGGTGGQFADVDNDGDPDLVIADARRKDGSRGPVVLLNRRPEPGFVDAADLDAGNLLSQIQTKGPAAVVAADLDDDGRLDLILAEMGGKPRIVRNATRGGNFLAIELQGTEEQGKKSRSNRSAIGARVEIKTGAITEQFLVGNTAGTTAMPPLRVHAGLGGNDQVQWLRVVWPDGVLQAELDSPAGKLLKLTETQRKISSCPHLFAWDGTQYRFVSDFGGMGGLGYMTGPGQYAPPDATEYVPVPGLQARDGQYVLQVLEPLEEAVYFDEAKLLAVDHPEGTRALPNEMMAVGLPPPAFEVFCFSREVSPVRAVDHRGKDVTEALARVDRQYAGATDPDPRFIGFAGDHAVELDFGDRLEQLTSGRIVLVLNGWVEYGYSSTAYAAAQAGLVLRAPSFEVWRDGRWVELFHEAGYPAGIDHWMTLDLTGKLRPGDRKLRITSNMDLYWDRIFVAQPDGKPATVHTLRPHAAELHFFGYPREYSPDGRQPNLYDYSNVDRYLSWTVMPGNYTRYGDVTELVAAADDCFAVMAPGDELTLRFPAAALPPLPAGHRRTFLLKADSYCKDRDLYTGLGDTLGPLPFHAMTGYPYPHSERYPDTEKTRQYQRRYNTRVLK